MINNNCEPFMSFLIRVSIITLHLGDSPLISLAPNYTVRVMAVIGPYRNACGRGCCGRPPRGRADRVTATHDGIGKGRV